MLDYKQNPNRNQNQAAFPSLSICMLAVLIFASGTIAQTTCVDETYYYNADLDLCIVCPFGCLECCDENLCSVCAEEFVLDSNTGLCEGCPENCIECAENLTCLMCMTGATLTSGACVSCPTGCLTCNADQTCISCD